MAGHTVIWCFIFLFCLVALYLCYRAETYALGAVAVLCSIYTFSKVVDLFVQILGW